MKNRLLFIIIISVSLIIFQYMLYILSPVEEKSFIIHLIRNLPVTIIIGIIDFLIIDSVYKHFRYKYKMHTRITIDLTLTTLIVTIFSFTANFILSLFNEFGYKHTNALHTTFPLILWNIIIVLLIEIFFYNQRYNRKREKDSYNRKRKKQISI